MSYPAHSILAIDSSPFGQSLSLVPVMRTLRESYPKTFLVAAAPAGTCELLSAWSLVDDSISLGVIKPPNNGPSSALKRLWRLLRRSRRYNFDLVLDFSPRIETQFISRMVLRARVFTPLRLPGAFGALLEIGGVARPSDRSRLSRYKNVLQQVGVEMHDARLAIRTTAEEDARFEHRLARSGSRGGELIVLLYARNTAARRGWTIAEFAEVGSRLVNNFNARIIVADEPSDDAFTRALSAWMQPGAIKLTEPRVFELFAAIARASIVITDEPAVARIASELGTPSIEIADTFSKITESSTNHRIVQGSSRKQFSTDEVFDIASEMIQENRSASLFQRS
jgi:ADP-heptose:LPS heptosyltransferase